MGAGGRGPRRHLQGAAHPPGPRHQVIILYTVTIIILFPVTRGTREEKFKFIYGILSVESGGHIERGDLARFILESDGASSVPASLSSLFAEGKKMEK